MGLNLISPFQRENCSEAFNTIMHSYISIPKHSQKFQGLIRPLQVFLEVSIIIHRRIICLPLFVFSFPWCTYLLSFFFFLKNIAQEQLLPSSPTEPHSTAQLADTTVQQWFLAMLWDPACLLGTSPGTVKALLGALWGTPGCLLLLLLLGKRMWPPQNSPSRTKPEACTSSGWRGTGWQGPLGDLQPHDLQPQLHWGGISSICACHIRTGRLTQWEPPARGQLAGKQLCTAGLVGPGRDQVAHEKSVLEGKKGTNLLGYIRQCVASSLRKGILPLHSGETHLERCAQSWYKRCEHTGVSGVKGHERH